MIYPQEWNEYGACLTNQGIGHGGKNTILCFCDWSEGLESSVLFGRTPTSKSSTWMTVESLSHNLDLIWSHEVSFGLPTVKGNVLCLHVDHGIGSSKEVDPEHAVRLTLLNCT